MAIDPFVPSDRHIVVRAPSATLMRGLRKKGKSAKEIRDTITHIRHNDKKRSNTRQKRHELLSHPRHLRTVLDMFLHNARNIKQRSMTTSATNLPGTYALSRDENETLLLGMELFTALGKAQRWRDAARVNSIIQQILARNKKRPPKRRLLLHWPNIG